MSEPLHREQALVPAYVGVFGPFGPAQYHPYRAANPH